MASRLLHVLINGLAPFMIPWAWSWGSLLVIFVLLLLHMFVHGSIYLTILTFLPVVAVTLWFSWWFNGRRSWTRWTIVRALLRVVFLSTLFGALLALFAYETDMHDAWSQHVPLVSTALPFNVIKALPGLTALMLGAYVLTHYFVVFRHRLLPMVVPMAWGVAWLYIGITGFYYNTFSGMTADLVAAQDGVTVLFENPDTSCSIFTASEQQCPVRIFPRGLVRDPVTGRFVAAFGSTLHVSPRRASRLLAFDPHSNRANSFEELKDTNQFRDLWFSGKERRFAVSGWNDRRILVYSLDDWSLLQMIEVERGPTDWGPFLVALVDAHVYTVTCWIPEVFMHHVESGALVARYNGWESGVAMFGGCFHMGAMAPRRKRLYVLNLALSKQLLEFDLADLSLLRSLDLPTIGGYGLTVNEDAGRIFVQNHFPNLLFEIDIDTLEIVGEYPGIHNARYIAYDERRRRVYVADWLEGRLHVLDLDSGRYTRSYEVGAKPSAVFLDGDHVYVHSVVGIVRIDLSHG